MADRLLDSSPPGFLRQLHRVRACQHPVRLAGQVDRVDPITGELTPDFHSHDAPDGVVLVPCGNRRASRCPSCSDLHARGRLADRARRPGRRSRPTRHRDRSPRTVREVTAPSFGRVHTRDKAGPVRTCHPRRGFCPRVPPASRDRCTSARCSGVGHNPNSAESRP
ncbi:MAG: replication initiator [Frankiaceae bacterium]